MIVIGAKGHAKDILTIIEENAHNNSDYIFFDDYTVPKEEFFLGKYKIVHSLNEINFQETPFFISAIGSPDVRKKVVERFIEAGGIYQSIISQKAIIGSLDVELGNGVNIMPYTFISNSVKIGVGCLINTSAQVHHDVVIGDYCDISPGAKVLGRAKIGNNCVIGSGAIILPNVVLGDNVTVGAGSVVIESCLTEGTIVGVPGKLNIKES